MEQPGLLRRLLIDVADGKHECSRYRRNATWEAQGLARDQFAAVGVEVSLHDAGADGYLDEPHRRITVGRYSGFWLKGVIGVTSALGGPADPMVMDDKVGRAQRTSHRRQAVVEPMPERLRATH